VTGELRIGTSGWHYPAGAGTWNGPFYPKPRPKAFDELAFYSEQFSTVEINATFYGQPRAEICAQWAERTPRDFEFAVKLYQQFTHPKMFQARVAAQLAKELGSAEISESAVRALTDANQADFDEFRRGIEPLATAGKLGALLAQFPASFHNTVANRTHLVAVLRAMAGHPLAVELRHRSWSDAADETWQLLTEFGAAWTWIDEPRFQDSVTPPRLDRSGLVYMRLHGRNAKTWWRGSNEERYNYLYTSDELAPIAVQLAGAVQRGAKARAYMNNHFSAKAVVNAQALEELTRAHVPAPAPAFARETRYPTRSSSAT
jgi:uncharacterized protein YecE (DUF72 family)